MRIKIGKWYFFVYSPFQIRLIEEFDHKCLNQVMDGDYECEWCNPRETQTQESQP